MMAMARRSWWWALGLCVLSGCQALHLNAPLGDRIERTGKESTTARLTPPGKYQFRASQFVFLSDFEVQRDQPLFRELSTMREQIYHELQLPSSSTLITVYLFQDQEPYERFMKASYPDLPKRRAFFVAQPRASGSEDMLVYTYWSPRIEEDLRHELTHALLHCVLKDVPLWLDEGLAEYFEVPPGSNGVNARHLEQLRHGTGTPFKPDLARLEQLSQVQQMNPAEYREAWAWVHLMLHDKPQAKVVLTSYLQQLRVTASPGALGPRLATVYSAPNEALNDYLTRLDSAQATPHARGT